MVRPIFIAAGVTAIIMIIFAIILGVGIVQYNQANDLINSGQIVQGEALFKRSSILNYVGLAGSIGFYIFFVIIIVISATWNNNSE